jgi:hypothetical protein
MAGEATVYFTIADKTPPNIALNSICDVTYNQTSIPLNFVVNEPTTWIAYSLDNGTKTDIVSNTTLTVTTGVHSIAVYANDTAGNMGQSEVAHFAVQPWPQIGNIVVLIAIILAGMAAVVTLLVALRTRKSGNRPAE